MLFKYLNHQILRVPSTVAPDYDANNSLLTISLFSQSSSCRKRKTKQRQRALFCYHLDGSLNAQSGVVRLYRKAAGLWLVLQCQFCFGPPPKTHSCATEWKCTSSAAVCV